MKKHQSINKMSLFSYNGRAFQFRLVNLPNDVSHEIAKMILDNGGEIVNGDDPLVISFTVPDSYVHGKVMYDVQFIKDCVRREEIEDLYKYRLGSRKAYDGCIMSIFLQGSPSCMLYACNRYPRNIICPVCGSRSTFDIRSISDLPVPSQNSSDAQRVITSDISYKKGGSDATKCLKSISKKHASLFQDETEVSPKLKKLQIDGNASSQEASSIYETAEDLINSSPDSNLSLMQATEDGIDELPTDTESRTNIIVKQQIKETDELDLGCQRSVERSVNHAKHELHLDTSEIIHISSDSESEVELIEVANTSTKEHESHTKDESKKKAEEDILMAYKLKIHEQGKQDFGETSASNCIKNSLKSRKKNVMAGKENEKIIQRRSRISSEEEESPGSNNAKDHGRRDSGERDSEISRKGKKKPEKSPIKRNQFKSNLSSGSNIDVLAINDTNKNGKKSMKVPKLKSKLPTDNAPSVEGISTLNEDPQSNEDSTGSLTDPEGIFSNEANCVLRRRKTLPNTSYAMSNDDSDDVQEATRLKKNDKSSSKKNDNEDEHPTVSTSELEISDDSEASHHTEVKVESSNASHRPVRTELNINRERNGRPVQKNLDLKEWLTLAKRKAQNMAAPRMRNFAKWEKWHMLIFLIENDLIDHAKGLDAWQYMIKREEFGHRTKMSLNNHFLKYILPHIEEFRLPKDIESKFVALRNIKGH